MVVMTGLLTDRPAGGMNVDVNGDCEGEGEGEG
jgi:hypothetical protein